MLRICVLFAVAVIFTASTALAADGVDVRVGYGSKLAMECPAGQLVGSINTGRDILGLCVKPFVCQKHLLECKPTKCGTGEEPFVFLKGTKETRKDGARRRKKRGVVGKELKPSCCKVDPYSPSGDKLYEFKSYYTVFDNNAESGKPADAFNVEDVVGGIPYSGEYIKAIKKVVGGYVVYTGYIQCDKTTTEEPRTPPTEIIKHQQNPGGESSSSSGGPGCFSGDQMVETPSGPVRMDQLKAGDQVLTMAEPFGTDSYSKVTYFIHREPETIAKFLTLKTASERSVRMTPNHLIPVVPCDYESKVSGYNNLMNYYVPASTVELGSCLLDSSGVSPVVSISESQEAGIYSPITASGSIVANGVHCSVHVDAGELSHGVQVSLFRTLYLVKNFFGLEWMFSSQYDELPRLVEMLVNACSKF